MAIAQALQGHWKLTRAIHGVDFVEFAPDGRVARLTGFYEE